MLQFEDIVKELLSKSITTHEYFFEINRQLSSERSKLHQEIIDDILSSKPYSKERKVYMLGGAPANGKSSLLRSGLIPYPANALKVDVDEIKLMLSEYRYMTAMRNPKAATLVHGESATIGHELRNIALKNGYDLIWDGVGDEGLEHRQQVATEFTSYGHSIRIDYVTLDTALSIKLEELRYQQTGRRVPDSYLKEKNQHIALLVPELIRHQVFDELYLWDTNIHNQPRLILSQENGKLEVVNETLYNNFKMKGYVKGIIQTEGRFNQRRKKAHRL